MRVLPLCLGVLALTLPGAFAQTPAEEQPTAPQTPPAPKAPEAAVAPPADTLPDLTPPPPPPPAPAAAMPAFTPPATPGRPKMSGPLALEDAVRAALRNRPGLESLRAEERAAEARTRQARSMTRPQAALSGRAGLNTTEMAPIITSAPGVAPSAIMALPERSSVGETLMLMAPLYTGGRLSGMVTNARSLAGAAGQQVRASEQDVALQARTAYRRVLLARAVVSIYQDRVAAARERVRIAREQYSAGSVNLADVLRNQTDLAGSQQQLANTQRDLEVALVDLKTVMGVDLSSDIQVDGRLPPVSAQTEEPSTSDLVARALKQRPEVSAADLRVRAAEAEVTAARGSFRPQVYLSAMQDAGLMRGGSMSGAGVQIVASIPLADAGLRRAQVDEAQARLTSAQQERESVTLQVTQEVSNAWLALQAARVNVETSEAAVAQAREDYRIAQERYQTGRGINVEVLDALTALVAARTNQVQALFDYNVSRDQLARALGELSGSQAG